MDVIYKYEFSIWFPPSVFKFWKPFLVASIVAESEFQNSNIGREQIENAVLVASFEISCDLTDDAWVSGPDLAPQKFLLSQ